MPIQNAHSDTKWLYVTFEDGSQAKYFGTWLRDNVGSSRHKSHGQKTFDLNLQSEINIQAVSQVESVINVRFKRDETIHRFDEDWLRAFSNPGPARKQKSRWNATLQDKLDFFDFKLISISEVNLYQFLKQVDQLGFALLENVPCVPKTIFYVVDLFGYVRQTNYGNLFDVRVEPDPSNLAFTSERIGMHTDNPYRDPVPGLQLLHCLVNNSDGGENQLVDGFNVCEQLREEYPAAFEVLVNTPVKFRYFDEGSADLVHHSPLISMLGDEIIEVRYNARSIQAFDLPSSHIADFYNAYRLLGRAFHADYAKIQFKLNPGQLVIFDNQRVLHGRTAYHEGARHLQGCYADKDSLRSKLRILEAPT